MTLHCTDLRRYLRSGERGASPPHARAELFHVKPFSPRFSELIHTRLCFQNPPLLVNLWRYSATFASGTASGAGNMVGLHTGVTVEEPRERGRRELRQTHTLWPAPMFEL